MLLLGVGTGLPTLTPVSTHGSRSGARTIALQPIRVAIADDHEVVREGLALLLQRDAGMSVVGQVGHAHTIPAMIEHSHCDVLLLDLKMDRNTFVDITSLADKVKVIALTEQDEQPSTAAAVFLAGARGLVTKHCSSGALVEAIHAVACGGTWVPPGLRGSVVPCRRRG
jgi:two-component system response regulator NreC